MWETFLQEFSPLGESALLPVTVILLSICLGVKVSKALRSGLMIGAGFAGIDLLLNMMNSEIGTAAQEMSLLRGLHLDVVDLGWQSAAPMAWASGLAAAAIPIAIGVNLLMLGCKVTKTVNIDLWNIWHMIFTGGIVYAATGNLWLGCIGVAAHAAVVYKLGDLWAPWIADYFELEGLTVPHGISAYMAPVACLVEIVFEKIPVLGKIRFSTEQFQEKAGILADPAMLGFLMGGGIGLLAEYSLPQTISLGVKMAGVMILMPKVVKCIMEGMAPLAERVRDLLTRHFQGREFYIGLDPAILLGDPQVITAGMLLIPITLLTALLMPGNRVIPFGDLAALGFFIAIAAAIHHGNLFRTLVSGSLIMYLTIWITNQMIPYITALGEKAGTLDGSHMAAALDQGGSPLTYLYFQAATGEFTPGFFAVAVFYGLCLAASVVCFRFESKTK